MTSAKKPVTKKEFKRYLELDETVYEERKVAIYDRLRTKWPTRSEVEKTDQGRLDVTECIKPLVVKYLPRNTAPDLMEYWLSKYTVWAIAINSWSREEKRKSDQSKEHGDNDETELGDRPVTDSELRPYGFVVNRDDQAAFDDSFDSSVNQRGVLSIRSYVQSTRPATQVNAYTTPTMHSTTSETGNTSTSSVDWDDVELAIDAAALGLGTILLPMIKLKPRADEPCHWNDFTFAKLTDSIEEETGTKIKAGSCEFMYNDLVFTNPSGFNIVLKRFVKVGYERGNILHLRVQQKVQAGNNPNTLTREAGREDNGLQQQGPKRKVGSSSGSAANRDMSEEETTDEETQQLKVNLPERMTKRTRVSGFNYPA